MAALQAIRKGVSDQVGLLSGFSLSKHPPDYFGRQQNTIAHLSYAVAIGSCRAQPERQRRNDRVYCSTDVVVQFAYRLRPLDVYPTDYDLALAQEKAVIEQCLRSYEGIATEMQIRFVGSDRETIDSNEYMVHTIQLTAYHTL